MYNIPHEIIPLILRFFRTKGQKDEYMFDMVNNIIHKRNLYMESEIEKKYIKYSQKQDQNTIKNNNISLDCEINMIPLHYSEDFKYKVDEFRNIELLDLRKNWTLKFFEIMERRFKYGLIDHCKLLFSENRCETFKDIIIGMVHSGVLLQYYDKDFIILYMNINEQVGGAFKQIAGNINNSIH